MGDFYLGAVDTKFLELIDEKIKNKDKEEGDAKAAAFYTETPYISEIGLDNKEEALMIQVDVNTSKFYEDNGWFTPNRLLVRKSDFHFKYGESNLQKDFEDLVMEKPSLGSDLINKKIDNSNPYFFIDFYGTKDFPCNTWAYDYPNFNSEDNNKIDKLPKYITKKIKDIKDNSNYVYAKNVHSDNADLDFVFIANRYREYDNISKNENGLVNSIRYCIRSSLENVSTDKEENNIRYKEFYASYLEKLRSVLKEYHNRIYLLVDLKNVTYTPKNEIDYTKEDYIELQNLAINSLSDKNKSSYPTGYELALADNEYSIKATPYVREGGEWVNLSKLMLTYFDEKSLKEFNINEPIYDDEFKASDNKKFGNTYDINKVTYADAFFETLDDLDNRWEIQKELSGKEYEYLQEWTVTIGDVTLKIPPTNISVTSEIAEERVPLIRANGSMPKQGGHNHRIINLDVYFYGEEGINGQKYDIKTPNGFSLTYNMNGLRALISQFKFAPFLPIENLYINETLSIEAVVFNGIHITNVPSIGPKLYKATISLMEFAYEAYMPEHLTFCAENEIDGNYFSKAFNWNTFRYYYQKPLLLGDYIKEKGFAFNSKEYNIFSTLNRTAFQPMNFNSNTMKFYIADSEYLNMLLRKNLKKKKNPYVEFNDTEKDIVMEIGKIFSPFKPFFKGSVALNPTAYFKVAKDGTNKLFTKSYKMVAIDKGDELSPIPLYQNNSYVSDYDDSNIETVDDPIYKDANSYKDVENAYIKSVDNMAIFGMQDFFQEYILPSEKRILKLRILRADLIDNSSKEHSNWYVGDVVFKFKFDKEYDKLNRVLENNSTDENLKEFKRKIGNIINSDSLDDLFSDKTLNINLKILFDENNSTKTLNDYVRVDTSKDDIKFINFCIGYYNDEKERDRSYDQNGFNNANRNTGFEVNKNTLDYNNLLYREYKLSSLIVESFSISLSNRITNTHLKDVNSATPQYMGGEDITFEVKATTRSKLTVKRLLELPGITSNYVRKYHPILSSFPLRIDSEITRFVGVTDVSINDVYVSTIPNQPDTYEITFRLISVDRTIRTREAAKMHSLSNEGFIHGDKDNKDHFILRFLSTFNWMSNPKDRFTDRNLASYFQLDNIISQAELYPDLELPTIYELSTLGYEFVRYKFQDSRIYVDPDFYFMYFGKLSSQYLRELVINSTKEGIDGSQTYTDNSGASAFIKAEAHKGYTIRDKNQILEDQMQHINMFNKATSDLNNKKLHDNIRIADKNIVDDDTNGWVICNNIRCVFLERKYKKEYDTFIANLKKDGKDISNLDEILKEIDNSSEEKHTEGVWVAKQLKPYRDVSNKIKNYLKYNAIPITVDESKNPIYEKYNEAIENNSNLNDIHKSVKQEIFKTVSLFLNHETIGPICKEIFIDLNNKNRSKFELLLNNIIYASACAATGTKEYTDKKQSTDWFPDPSFLASILINKQDKVNYYNAKDYDEATKLGVEFGIFKIKTYHKLDLEKLLNETIEENNNTDYQNRFVLDPYYRIAGTNRASEYKSNCIKSISFCTFAYLRLMLFWIMKFIDAQVFPAITCDISRNTSLNELEIQQKLTYNKVSTNEDKTLENNISFFRKNGTSIDLGKAFLGCLIASSDGNRMLIDHVDRRNYEALNSYMYSSATPSNIFSGTDTVSMHLRKTIFALCGLNIITDLDSSNITQSMNTKKMNINEYETKYIEAAEDPSQYLMHSCHDMIVNDGRGRRIRAFPTFYMMIIDEGRELGYYKLHDNFYNMMNIMSIDIVKSRKIPADTANIMLSNFYQTSLSNYDPPNVKTNIVEFMDVVDSIFNESKTAQRLESIRKSQEVPETLRLKPGARIHVRMGYGSNAVMLPILFNGTIAEVSANDVVELVAQGDGIELCNPMIDDVEGWEIVEQDSLRPKWLINRNSATPKEIAVALFNTNGGFISKQLQKLELGNIARNPYGIKHFGSPDYTRILKMGECSQNIFDAFTKQRFVEDQEESYSIFSDDEPPYISMDTFDKTPWEVLNVCRSVSPDYICAIAPFEYRSTVFMGNPRFYYAYKYFKSNGKILEKRKPYQQFHSIASSTDIIENKMTASKQNIKTVALGTYKEDETIGSHSVKTVGPLYADYDIYDENQKSMLVDTQLICNGDPGAIGWLTRSIMNADFVADYLDDSIINNIFGIYDDEGQNIDARKVAWKMTASALKNQMKEMYDGDIILFGNPSIKPYDRIFINDDYTYINGQVEVRDVIHHISGENGFTTTIVPDLIVTVDDPHEKIKNSWLRKITYLTARLTLIYFAVKHGRIYANKKLNKLKDSEIYKEYEKLVDDYSQKIKDKFKSEKEELNKKAKETFNKINDKLPDGLKNKTLKDKRLNNLYGKSKGIFSKTGKAVTKTYMLGLKYGSTALTGGLVLLGDIFLSNLVAEFTRYLKNLEVLHIYPVKINNNPWTAGLDGSKGMIYGSPTEKEQGALQTFAAKCLGSAGETSFLGDALRFLFVSEELERIASSHDRDAYPIEDEDYMATSEFDFGDNKISEEEFVQKVKLSSTANGINKSRLPNDYRRLQVTPRADKDDLNAIVELYGMKDPYHWKSDNKLRNNSLISDDTRISAYIKDGFFKIVHDLPELNEGMFVESQTLKLNGENRDIKIIKYNNEGTNKDEVPYVYDIPLLNNEAIDILYEILRRTKNNMPHANSSDPYEIYNKTKDSFICLESALKIGDINTLACTGYTFILSGYSTAVDALKDALKDFYDEIKSDSNSNEALNSSIFEYSFQHQKVAISVLPPKVRNYVPDSAVSNGKRVRKPKENKVQKEDKVKQDGNK